MPDYRLPNEINQTGELETLATYLSGEVLTLAPLILFFLYAVIVGSGYYSDQRRKGSASFAMWSAIAGLIVSTIGFILFLIPGMMSLESLVLIVILTLVSALWFLFTKID